MVFWVPILLGSPLIILTIISLAFGGQRDIVETYETRLRVLCAIVFVACVGILGTMTGGIVLGQATDLGGLLLRLPLTVFLAGPLLVAFWAYFRLPGCLEKAYAPCFVQPRSSQWAIVALVNELARQVGLRTPPRVVISGRPVMWPFVISGRGRTTLLVCPSCFKEMLSARAKSMGDAPEAYLRFVLLHELAHIRHGDAAFLCWAYCFRQTMKRWLVVGLLLLLGATAWAFWTPTAVMERAIPVSITNLLFLVAAGIGLLCIFTCLCNSVRRRRELDADARAWLCAFGAAAPNGDPIHRLLVSLEQRGRDLHAGTPGFAEWVTGLAGNAPYGFIVEKMPSFLRKSWGMVLSTYPTPEERIKAMTELRSGTEKRPLLTNEAAFWSGVNVGLMSGISMTGTLLWRMTDAFQPPIALMQSYILAGLISAAAVYASAVLALPVRESIRPRRGVRQALGIARSIGMMATGYFAGAACFGTRTLVVAPLTLKAVLLFSAVTVGIAYLSSALRTMRQQGELRVFLFLVPGALACVLVISCFSLWHRVNASGAWIGIGVGLFAGFFLFPFVPFPRHISWQDMFLIVGWGRWVIFRIEGRKFINQWVTWSVVFGVLVFASPYLIVFASLVAFPGWAESADRWLSSSGLELAVALIAAYYVIGSMALSSTPARLLPQVAACAKALNSVRASLPRGFFIAHEVGNLERCVLPRVLNNRSSLHCMEAMHAGSLALHSLGTVSTSINKETAQAVLECECEDGGFGVWKGSSPRLSTTYWAVLVLDLCSALRRNTLGKHVDYVSRCRQSSHLYCCEFSRRSALEETFFAVGCLSLLESIEVVDRIACSRAILKEWRSGKQDEASTYYCVKSLEWLDKLESLARGEIRDNWLGPRRLVMQGISVGKNLDQVFHYVEIIRVLEQVGYVSASEFIPLSWPGSLERVLHGLASNSLKDKRWIRAK